jgi:hypothetical protein
MCLHVTVPQRMFVICLILLGFVVLQFFSLFIELIYHEKDD